MENIKIINVDNFKNSTPQENAIMLVEMFGDLFSSKEIRKLIRRFPIRK